MKNEEMGRLGWSAGDLASRPKNEPGKLVIAARLRREAEINSEGGRVRRRGAEGCDGSGSDRRAG
jgi:hypothetical protein